MPAAACRAQEEDEAIEEVEIDEEGESEDLEFEQ
jgi:hypothetical protein